MKIKIEFETEYKKVKPKCHVSTINDGASFDLEKKLTVDIDLVVVENDNLSIEFLNKDDNDDNVIKIKSIHIDDINLQHFIYKGVFRPAYNNEWYSKQDPKPPSEYTPCLELRHHGIWSLEISTPIWKMIMEQWINDKTDS